MLSVFLTQVFIYFLLVKSKKFSFFTHNVQYNNPTPLISYSFQEYIKKKRLAKRFRFASRLWLAI